MARSGDLLRRRPASRRSAFLIAASAALIGLTGTAVASSGAAEAAPSGNAAATAQVTGSAAASGTPAAIVDRADITGQGTGAEWIAPAGTGGWVRLDWQQATPISSVQLFGATGGATTIGRGTLSFSDGTSLVVGELTKDRTRPTTVAFPSKTVTWAKFTVDGLKGNGTAGIAEFAAFRTGTTPPKSLAMTTPSRISVALASQESCSTPPAGVTTLTVLCPGSGAVVSDSTTVSVFAPGASSMQARVVHSPSGGPSVDGPTVTARPNANSVFALTFDATRLAHGPITVVLTPTGGPATSPVYLGLYNGSGPQATASSAVGATIPVPGLDLVYSEEFTSPVSFSRTGAGADYASSKPEYWGANDFGDAIFADPSEGADNMGVVDDEYLRISLSPKTASIRDPSGWNRKHIGGILSSGKVGGSGFSAQYGYFEARMLTPLGKGMWPAFWLMPSDNLIAPQPEVVEIDVMEGYGQNGLYNCQTTHLWTKAGDMSGKPNCADKFTSMTQALGWHVYGARVGVDAVTYYIDGKVVAVDKQVSAGDRPLFFMANMSAGGGWPIDLGSINNSASMYIDYIRVYT